MKQQTSSRPEQSIARYRDRTNLYDEQRSVISQPRLRILRMQGSQSFIAEVERWEPKCVHTDHHQGRGYHT